MEALRWCPRYLEYVCSDLCINARDGCFEMKRLKQKEIKEEKRAITLIPFINSEDSIGE